MELEVVKKVLVGAGVDFFRGVGQGGDFPPSQIYFRDEFRGVRQMLWMVHREGGLQAPLTFPWPIYGFKIPAQADFARLDVGTTLVLPHFS